MSKQVSTMNAAAFAELFGELDGLNGRVQASQEAMRQLEAHLKEVRESETTKAAKELSEAAEKFGKITTQSVDDFVGVANEALAKFMARTEEIKALLDKPLATKPNETFQPKKAQAQQKTAQPTKSGKITLKEAAIIGFLALIAVQLTALLLIGLK